MAIKGKSKPKSKRVVTAGPKPAYVVPKKRLLARRGFQVTVVILLAIGLGSGLTYAYVHQRNQQRAAELKRNEEKYIGEYKSKVESALGSVGQPNQTGSFDVLPELLPTIDRLKKDDKASSKAAGIGEDAARKAKDAYRALADIDAPALVRDKGFSEQLAGLVTGSREDMINGLKLYERLALAVAAAAKASGSQRASLLTTAEGIEPTAKKIFGAGYFDFVQSQQIAGIFGPTFAQPPGGIPPGAGLPPGAGIPPGGIPPGGAAPPGAP